MFIDHLCHLFCTMTGKRISTLVGAKKLNKNLMM